MTPRGTTFELERFLVAPVTSDVSLLEVEGLLAGAPARSGPPRLLVEHEGGGRREHAAVEAIAGDGRVRVSFAVPAGDVEAAGLALAVGGLLLDLPTPDPVPGADRTVALLREVNSLRHEVTAHRRGDASAARAVEERAAAAEQQAEERVTAAEAAARERVAAAEDEARRHEIAADQVAVERVAAAEQAAAEREAELSGVAAELERSVGELEALLVDERAAAEQRDGAAAAERARMEIERDAAREEATAGEALAVELARVEEESRAALDALRRRLDQREAELSAASGSGARAAASPTRDRTTVALGYGDLDTEERSAAEDTLEAPAGAGTIQAEGGDTQSFPAVGGDTPDVPAGSGDAENVPAAGGDTLSFPAVDAATRGAEAADDAQGGPAERGGSVSSVAADEMDFEPDDDDGVDADGDGEDDEDRPRARSSVIAPPSDTGPIPLRRRRRYAGPTERDAGSEEATRVVAGGRPRATASPVSPGRATASPGSSGAQPLPASLAPPSGPSSRTLALAAIAVAGLLVLVAILGFLL